MSSIWAGKWEMRDMAEGLGDLGKFPGETDTPSLDEILSSIKKLDDLRERARREVELAGEAVQGWQHRQDEAAEIEKGAWEMGQKWMELLSHHLTVTTPDDMVCSIKFPPSPAAIWDGPIKEHIDGA